MNLVRCFIEFLAQIQTVYKYTIIKPITSSLCLLYKMYILINRQQMSKIVHNHMFYIFTIKMPEILTVVIAN